jgi:cell division protein FtsL
MIRLNVVLLVAVLVSAFYLVHLQYESRQLHAALHRADVQRQRLSAELEQLQVQQRAQAKPARIQLLAEQQLAMRSAHPGITEYIHVSTSVGTVSTGRWQP